MTFIDDVIIQEGAIFIADSHFKTGDLGFLEFLSKIPRGRQIFLMGDIFHLLVGYIDSSKQDNIDLIDKLLELSLTNDVIFIEGNHDVCVENLLRARLLDIGARSKLDYNNNYQLQRIKIFPYKSQPLIVKSYQDYYCILAHGDLWIGNVYAFYRKMLYNSYAMSFLRILDSISLGVIYRRFSTRINKKRIYRFSFFRQDFEDFMIDRISKYRRYVLHPILASGGISSNDRFCIIEGHFHLGMDMAIGNIRYNSLHSCYLDRKYLTLCQDRIVEVCNGTK